MSRFGLGIAATLLGVALILAWRAGRAPTAEPAADSRELAPLSAAPADRAEPIRESGENAAAEARQGRELAEAPRPPSLARNVEELARARPEIVAFTTFWPKAPMPFAPELRRRGFSATSQRTRKACH